MFNKLYEEIKIKMRENYKWIIIFFLFLFVMTIEFPYYVDAPGGIMNISSKMTVEGGYSSTGSFNLAYVSELKGTIPVLLLSQFQKDWNIVKKEEVVLENETEEENSYRNHLLLEEANQNALMVAYEKAGKEVVITNQKLFVTYALKEGKNNLKIKDQIISVNHQPVHTVLELQEAIKENESGDVLPITVIRNNQEMECEAEIYEWNGKNVIGIVLSEEKELEVEPNITFSFDAYESGPSGGLMMSLAIYDALTEEDITRGYTIVGTGTIARDGTVGEIGGVEYKLKGAVKAKADIFFVPSGENYEEALALKEEKNYDIELIPIQTFEEALEYLQSLPIKD